MKKPISLQLLFIYMYLFYFKSSVIDIYYIKTIWFYNKAPLKKVVWLSSNARPNFWKLEKKNYCTKQGCKFSGNCLNSGLYEAQIPTLLFIFSPFWRLLAQIHALFQAFALWSAYIPDKSIPHLIFRIPFFFLFEIFSFKYFLSCCCQLVYILIGLLV